MSLFWSLKRVFWSKKSPEAVRSAIWGDFGVPLCVKMRSKNTSENDAKKRCEKIAQKSEAGVAKRRSGGMRRPVGRTPGGD